MILCVEDEAELRADIIDELRASGHDAIGADDGRQALDILKQVRPDLILCDISMPVMDGYELLETVRSRRTDLADVPFLFLTALNRRDAVITGKRAGVDDYLVKPIDFDLMLASIDARLAQARRMREFNQLTEHGPGRSSSDQLLMGMKAELLDLLSFGIVLVDATGEVVFANHKAKTLAETSGCFSLRGRLRGSTSDLTRRLGAQIAEVAGAGQAGSDMTRGLALPRPDGDGEILLIICSLAGSDAGPGMAALFLCDPARQATPPEHLLTALFGLTPAEARLASGLVSGERTSDIARALRISRTTVAFHLRNLFEKTGTNRQADLIALIMKTLAALK